MPNSIISRNTCYQCGVCSIVCPQKCIDMKPSIDSSFQPILSSKRCIKCGICSSLCGLHQIPPLHKTTYFLMQSNPENEEKCASGGAFLEIAKKAIERGYYVCAATMIKEDGLFLCKHIIVDSINELQKVSGTKYIRSECWHSFPKMLQLIKDNKKVLFVGTPCQVNALQRYTKGFNSNLLTIDLFCFGVASPTVLNKYLLKLEKIHKSSVDRVFFRKKIKGKKGTYFTIEFSNGIVVNQPNHFSQKQFYGFPKAFASSFLCDKICFDCNFKSRYRVGDISLGDVPMEFFNNNQNRLATNFDMNRGISIVGVRNKSFLDFFDSTLIPVNDILETPCFRRQMAPSNKKRKKTIKQLFGEVDFYD